MALVEASIEGPIDSVASDGASGAIIVAMGVKILYSPGPVLVVPPDTGTPPAPVRQKSLRSPSQRLTVADLLSTVPLPGRGMTPGFVGGTVIAEGFYSTDTASGTNVFLANHITVDPAETVLIGAVTRNNGTAIQVNTVDIEPLTDPRISTNPAAPSTPVYLNAFGFEIQLASMLRRRRPRIRHHQSLRRRRPAWRGTSRTGRFTRSRSSTARQDSLRRWLIR